VLELDPGNSWASQVVKELQPEVQQRQEKIKEEMIGGSWWSVLVAGVMLAYG
jgi:hypothetical protein